MAVPNIAGTLLTGPHAINSDPQPGQIRTMIDFKREDAGTLYEVYERALEVLSEAEAVLWTLPQQPELEAYIRVHTGVVISILSKLRAPLVLQYRELDTERPEGPPDSLLDADEQLIVDHLTEAETQHVDTVLLGHCTTSYRKVAFIIGKTMTPSSEELDHVPFGYLVQRVQHLVESGRLEGQGDLDYVRFSEVRIPN